MEKKRWAYMFFIVGLLFFSIFGIYFWNGEKRFNKMVIDFTGRRINGLVTKSAIGLRGFYHIDINDNISDSVLKYYVPKSWFFRENSISVGDSVSKEKNDKVMMFYKLKNGVFNKCCEYEIGM